MNVASVISASTWIAAVGVRNFPSSFSSAMTSIARSCVYTYAVNLGIEIDVLDILILPYLHFSFLSRTMQLLIDRTNLAVYIYIEVLHAKNGIQSSSRVFVINTSE